MAKALTAAGIQRYKPSKQRREIRDGAATGLYLVLQESGQRSFALRFRKLNGKPAKLTLAACRTEVYSMIANDSFVGANVHRTRDRAQSALLRSPIELASRCLGCI